jgi:hypothetical protein
MKTEIENKETINELVERLKGEDITLPNGFTYNFLSRDGNKYHPFHPILHLFYKGMIVGLLYPNHSDNSGNGCPFIHPSIWYLLSITREY